METLRGPVCILAGAGSGKTTTITRRIAHQVVAEVFKPNEILAVTFTRKAADELKARLATLGALGVPARTFHAAAYAQLRYFAAETRPVLNSKVQLFLPIVRGLPKPFNDRAASDIATEIEWAKNGRLDPDAYAAAVSRNGRRPPLPVELMADVYREYERRKGKANEIDHEDQLELTIRMFEADESKLAEFRERYRAFTVIRLEANYRSTPEILSVANRLAPRLGGARKTLRATRPSGPKPAIRSHETNDDEAAFVAARVGALQQQGVPLREIAVLYRVNFRSPLYEEALLEAGIPFQVREGAFLERKAARALLPRLERRSGETDIARSVEGEASRAGYLETPPPDLGPAELTRSNSKWFFCLRSRIGRFLTGARSRRTRWPMSVGSSTSVSLGRSGSST